MALTTSRPPFTRLTTPCGRSHCCSRSTIMRCESGTCSDGFSTKVLPVAIANGRNHIGTIAGKLNGAIAATTPSGWRTTWQSTPARNVLEPGALHQRRRAAGDFDALDAAAHAAARFVERLAVLGRHRARQRLEVLLAERLELVEDLRARVDRRVAPGGERRRRRLHGGVDVGAVESGVRPMTSPTAGLCTSKKSVARAFTQRPPMKLSSVLDVGTVRRPA